MKILQTPMNLCARYVAVVAISWAGLLGLHRLAVEDVGTQAETFWVYLPAGFRLLLVMILEWNAVVGVIAGRLLEFFLFERGSVPEVLILALVAGLSPALALYLMSQFVRVGLNLNGLRARHLWLYAFWAALFNALFSELYFGFTETFPTSITFGLRIFIGNFLGSILVFFVISLFISRFLFRLPLKDFHNQDL